MARRNHSAGGFTLIELLVAIGILAMVAVLGWRGLDSIMRSREVLTGQLEQARGMQLAFAQMQSDCDHLAGAGHDGETHQRRLEGAEALLGGGDAEADAEGKGSEAGQDHAPGAGLETAPRHARGKGH